MMFQAVSVSPVTPGVGPPVGPMTAFGPKVKVAVLAPDVSVKVVACVPLKLADCAFASPDRPAPNASAGKTAENPRKRARLKIRTAMTHAPMNPMAVGFTPSRQTLRVALLSSAPLQPPRAATTASGAIGARA